MSTRERSGSPRARSTGAKKAGSGLLAPTSSEMNSQGTTSRRGDASNRARWAMATPLVTMARVQQGASARHSSSAPGSRKAPSPRWVR